MSDQNIDIEEFFNMDSQLSEISGRREKVLVIDKFKGILTAWHPSLGEFELYEDKQNMRSKLQLY